MNGPEQLELMEPGAGDWCQRWEKRMPSWKRTRDGGFNPGLHRKEDELHQMQHSSQRQNGSLRWSRPRGSASRR
ncbi:hypothetical protein AB0F20_38890, partial [Streptomyces goshikiensis]